MVTRTRRGPYTYADYLLTPDDVRYELIDGELIVAPTPIPLHQRIGMRFTNRMGPFISGARFRGASRCAHGRAFIRYQRATARYLVHVQRTLSHHRQKPTSRARRT